MAKPNAEPLLVLDALAGERSVIEVDGARYEVFHPDELSVIQSHRFARWASRIRELQEQDGEDAERQLDEITDRAARAAFVDIPDAVFAKIKGAQKSAIVEVFTALLLRRAVNVAGAMHRAAGTTPEWMMPNARSSTSTGGGSSLPWPGSTAAAPRRSWWKRLLAWFGA